MNNMIEDVKKFLNQPVDVISAALEKMGLTLSPQSEKPMYYIISGPYKTNDGSEPMRNLLNGLIFDIKGNIMCWPQNPAVEIRELSEPKQAETIAMIKKQKFSVYESIDGTLIRAWYHNDSWHASSNKKIDINAAMWQNTCFGTLYDSFNPQQKLNNADIRFNYYFMMCHPSYTNIIVHDEPKLYHVGTIDPTALAEVKDVKLIGFDYLEPINIDNIDDLVQMAKEATAPVPNSVGYTIVPVGGALKYRIENANYTVSRKLRGNFSDNTRLAINVISTEKTDSRTNYRKEYVKHNPQDAAKITMTEVAMNELVQYIYQTYCSRHIAHEDIWVPTPIHRIVEELHYDYMRCLPNKYGKKPKITIGQIDNLVASKNETEIQAMMTYKYEINQHNESTSNKSYNRSVMTTGLPQKMNQLKLNSSSAPTPAESARKKYVRPEAPVNMAKKTEKQ